MTDLFDDEEPELVDDIAHSDHDIIVDVSKDITLNARRILEKRLEEKRLRDELDDFVDI